MTRIELYVVKTKWNMVLEENLEKIKKRLCLEYGGLTVIPSCTGYWLDADNLVEDNVEIWVILTKSKDQYSIVESYAREICKITDQKAQLFTIDNEPYLI